MKIFTIILLLSLLTGCGTSRSSQGGGRPVSWNGRLLKGDNIHPLEGVWEKDVAMSSLDRNWANEQLSIDYKPVSYECYLVCEGVPDKPHVYRISATRFYKPGGGLVLNKTKIGEMRRSHSGDRHYHFYQGTGDYDWIADYRVGHRKGLRADDLGFIDYKRSNLSANALQTRAGENVNLVAAHTRDRLDRQNAFIRNSEEERETRRLTEAPKKKAQSVEPGLEHIVAAAALIGGGIHLVSEWLGDDDDTAASPRNGGRAQGGGNAGAGGNGIQVKVEHLSDELIAFSDVSQKHYKILYERSGMEVYSVRVTYDPRMGDSPYRSSGGSFSSLEEAAKYHSGDIPK